MRRSYFSGTVAVLAGYAQQQRMTAAEAAAPPVVRNEWVWWRQRPGHACMPAHSSSLARAWRGMWCCTCHPCTSAAKGMPPKQPRAPSCTQPWLLGLACHALVELPAVAWHPQPGRAQHCLLALQRRQCQLAMPPAESVCS